MTSAPAVTTATTVDVTVLLGSRWASLRTHGTRWRAVVSRWRDDARVGRLTVVDFPRFAARPPRVEEHESWLPGVRSLHATVPAPVRTTPWDRLAWRLAGAALGRALDADRSRHVVVAATPLWAPVLPALPAVRRCFDAVDDWRALESMSAARRRVEAGYGAVRRADAVTAVTASLAGRLGQEFDVAGVLPVGNGVDLGAFAGDLAAPTGLPDGPFAVYVGSIERRVDLDLLSDVARRLPDLPIVVAGPATPVAAGRLAAGPLHWLGPVDVTQVPGLLARASVGLLPHRTDELTASMDPMKLLDYLAAGLPVVSTPVAGSDRSERVHVAADAARFADLVRSAAASPRLPGPDPAVVGSDWTVVADRLLTTYAGGLL